MTAECIFCEIAGGRASARVIAEWDDAIAFAPRSGGVTAGHVIVVPRRHVADVGVDPTVTGAVMARAAELAARMDAVNVITSKGVSATQTVFHLHVHVVPRRPGDGLPLPWTPQHEAAARTAAAEADMAAPHWTLGEVPANIRLVCAREPLPAGPSVFLAGPTPDQAVPVPSWRPDAINELSAQWDGDRPLTVLCPESRGRRRAERYEHQVDWESAARDAAGAILFWIPRDMKTLPGMTTNVEWGLDVRTGRAVLGCPPDCPNPERNRYLIHLAHRYAVPVCATLPDTATAALMITKEKIAEAEAKLRTGSTEKGRT
ncbi:nucleoside 2-deoxyribosyltransferase domain-containing protein [Streptosporangium sp. G11]|uniref:nucleoside 2-deoxyribosyltransferase domain-containing protein n=1 Tax=Streptosporangium sp. G11 TaxID=3436926 RepID=UPI003EB70AF2